MSSTNAADYVETAGGAVFENNGGASAPALTCVQFLDGFESGDFSAWSRKAP